MVQIRTSRQPPRRLDKFTDAGPLRVTIRVSKSWVDSRGSLVGSQARQILHCMPLAPRLSNAPNSQ